MRTEEAELILRDARQARGTIAPFTDVAPDLDEAWGYEVQDLDRAHRRASGEFILGAKLGLTSVAKQQRMGVNQPIVGFLSDAMRVSPDALPGMIGAWAQPRIEPEIAFITARAISSPLAFSEAKRAVDAVAPAAEVIDSRYTDYRFRLVDVVADNTSAAGFLVGAPVHLRDLDDLARIQCQLEVNGRVAHAATGGAILGHPLHALVRLSEHLAGHGQSLPEGSLVLAGALTEAVPLIRGNRYTVRMGQLGNLATATNGA